MSGNFNKNDREVITLAEANKGRQMTRKVDTYEYESLAECIRSDQVPASEIAEILQTRHIISGIRKNTWINNIND